MNYSCKQEEDDKRAKLSPSSDIEGSMKMPAAASVTASSTVGCNPPSSASSYGYPTVEEKTNPSSTLTSKTTKTKKKKSTTVKHQRGKHQQPSYQENRECKPAPYYYYIDHSQVIDDDPLSPLSPALSVPNFVIKLHAILVCDQYRGIVDWMPHGRSFKILDQTRFEKGVLPVYFRQGSIASFYRQANGWGFRRMLKGPDKGSFYNERFLRGLPSLCKKMKRVGGAKISADVNIKHEPVLYKISADRPTPAELDKDSLDWIVLKELNQSCQKGGPSAKMPFVNNIDALAARAQAKKMMSLEKSNGENLKTELIPQSSLASASLGLVNYSTAAAEASGLGGASLNGLGALTLTNDQQSLLSQCQQALQMGGFTNFARMQPQAQGLDQIQGQYLQSQNQPDASTLLHMLQEGSAGSSTFGQQNQAPQVSVPSSFASLSPSIPQDGFASFLQRHQSQNPAQVSAASVATLMGSSGQSQQPAQAATPSWANLLSAPGQSQHLAQVSAPGLANLLSSSGHPSLPSPPIPASVGAQTNVGIGMPPSAQLAGLQPGSNNNNLTQTSTSNIYRELLQRANTTQGQQQGIVNSGGSLLGNFLQNSTQAPGQHQPASLQELLARQQQTAPALQQLSPGSPLLTTVGGLQQRQQQEQLLQQLLMQQQQQQQQQHLQQQPGQH